jgi:anti-anti-sigma regulatory factor
MTMRIDATVEDHVVTLRLSGRISSGDLDGVRQEIGGRGDTIVLDLDEVTLVDVEAVRFLIAPITRVEPNSRSARTSRERPRV